MIPYMVSKLAPYSSHLNWKLVKHVPGRGYFRAVPSQTGDKYVTSPPPPQPLNWSYISEATAGAPFEDRLYEYHSVSDALRTMREWALPLYPTERHLLVAKLEGVQFMGDEDPKFVFARISRLETRMRAVGIERNELKVVQIILRQLPERYDVVKTMTLADPQLTRPKLENTIRYVYSQRKAHEIAK